jgi:hypothetical protein
MKKIFTLLFSTALFTTAAFAQYGHRDRHDDVYVNQQTDIMVTYGNRYDKDFGRDGKRFGRGAYVFTARERDIAIYQINREFSYRIQGVRNKFGMSWFHKKRIINNLEMERDAEIAEVWRMFNSKKNKFGDNGRRYGNRW